MDFLANLAGVPIGYWAFCAGNGLVIAGSAWALRLEKGPKTATREAP